MTSPTASLSNIDQAIAMARAYVSDSPELADDSVNWFMTQRELAGMLYEGPPRGEWYRIVYRSGREHYIFDDDDRGVSQSERPDQEHITTISLPDRKPVFDALNRLVAEFRAWKYGFATASPRDPGRELSEDDLLPLSFAAACGHHDHTGLVTELQQRHPLPRERVAEAYRTSVGPAHEMRNHAYGLRTQCGISGSDCGAIRAAVDIADNVLRASPPEQWRSRATYYWEFFHRPIPNRPVTISEEEAVVREVTQAAIATHGAPVVIEVLDFYRDQAYERLERALAAPTYWEYAWELYEAVPYLCAAVVIAADLSQGGPRIDNPRRYEAIRRDLDEKRVRVADSFSFQLTDLDGSRWDTTRANLADRARQEGAAAANDYLDGLIEERYHFPRLCKPELITLAMH